MQLQDQDVSCSGQPQIFPLLASPESQQAFNITDWWNIIKSHKVNKSGDESLLISAVTYLCKFSGRQTRTCHDVIPAPVDASLAICHLITAHRGR